MFYFKHKTQMCYELIKLLQIDVSTLIFIEEVARLQNPTQLGFVRLITPTMQARHDI